MAGEQTNSPTPNLNPPPHAELQQKFAAVTDRSIQLENALKEKENEVLRLRQALSIKSGGCRARVLQDGGVRVIRRTAGNLAVATQLIRELWAVVLQTNCRGPAPAQRQPSRSRS